LEFTNKPIANVNIQGKSIFGTMFGHFRMKQWHYFVFQTEKHVIGFAIANAYYIGECFCFVVSKKSGKKYEYGEKSILSRSVISTSRSSVDSERNFVWKNKGNLLSISYKKDTNGWEVLLDLKLSNKETKKTKNLRGTLQCCVGKDDEQFSLVYPFLPHRPGYTNKAMFEVKNVGEKKSVLEFGKKNAGVRKFNWSN